MEIYESAAEAQDDKITDLKDELAETDEAIFNEKERLSSLEGNPKLNVKLSVGVQAHFKGAINFALIYGVYFFSITCLLLLI